MLRFLRLNLHTDVVGGRLTSSKDSTKQLRRMLFCVMCSAVYLFSFAGKQTNRAEHHIARYSRMIYDYKMGKRPPGRYRTESAARGALTSSPLLFYFPTVSLQNWLFLLFPWLQFFLLYFDFTSPDQDLNFYGILHGPSVAVEVKITNTGKPVGQLLSDHLQSKG